MNRSILGKLKEIIVLLLALNWINGCTSLPFTSSSSQQKSEIIAAGVEGGEQAQTPAQRKLHQQAIAFNKAIWEAPLTACIGKNTMAILLSINPKDIINTASDLIFTAADIIDAGSKDCPIDIIAADYVAKKQREYANSKIVLVSMTADVSGKNRQLNDLIDTVNAVIAEDDQKVADLNKKYEQGSINTDILFQEFKLVKADRDRITGLLLNANGQLNFFQEAKKNYVTNNLGISTAKFDKEIDAFQENIKTMKILWYRVG